MANELVRVIDNVYFTPDKICNYILMKKPSQSCMRLLRERSEQHQTEQR